MTGSSSGAKVSVFIYFYLSLMPVPMSYKKRNQCYVLSSVKWAYNIF